MIQPHENSYYSANSCLRSISFATTDPRYRHRHIYVCFGEFPMQIKSLQEKKNLKIESQKLVNSTH